jgi:nucleoside-diphosphate-sugar epimerase
MKINIKGTWNIAYACSKHDIPLYYASTCCVYGQQKVHPSTEESKPNPSEIYACSKLAGENVIMGYHHTYGLKYNFMRFATIYGEGCRCALGTHIFMGQALRGEPITVHGNGKQTRTLTYVGDLIDAIYMLYKSKKMNGIWNLTNEREISANEMVYVAKNITKSKSPIVYIPQRVGQTFKEQISAQKMLKEVGWKAKVDFEEGMARQYKWFVANNEVKNIYIMPK